MSHHLDVTLNRLHLKGRLDKWGLLGLKPKREQYTFGGTRAYVVGDLIIDLQLRSCTDKYNIPPCYGEHRMNREKLLSEPPHKPLYVDIDVPHISPMW